jgi:hypothetical protein
MYIVLMRDTLPALLSLTVDYADVIRAIIADLLSSGFYEQRNLDATMLDVRDRGFSEV